MPFSTTSFFTLSQMLKYLKTNFLKIPAPRSGRIYFQAFQSHISPVAVLGPGQTRRLAPMSLIPAWLAHLWQHINTPPPQQPQSSRNAARLTPPEANGAASKAALAHSLPELHWTYRASLALPPIISYHFQQSTPPYSKLLKSLQSKDEYFKGKHTSQEHFG